MKLISFIIPVYNTSLYLERCLTNLANYASDNEIIIINDGSTDSSQIIIDKFLAQCPSAISVYQMNAGLSAARNTGLKYSTCEYVCFIDSDDYINSIEFDLVIATLKNSYLNSPDIVVYGRIEEYGKWHVNIPAQLSYQEYQSGQEYFKISIKQGTYRTNVWDKLFKRDFLKSYDLHFVEGLLYEDMYFCLMAFMYSASVVVCPYYPYHYIHYNTTSITKQIRPKDLDVLKFVHMTYDFINKGNFTLNTQSQEFQLLIFNWVSSCLMNKYAYLSLYNQDALKIFRIVLKNDVFMNSVKYCNNHSVGLRQKVFSILLIYAPLCYKIVLHFSLKIKKLKLRYFK